MDKVPYSCPGHKIINFSTGETCLSVTVTDWKYIELFNITLTVKSPELNGLVLPHPTTIAFLPDRALPKLGTPISEEAFEVEVGRQTGKEVSVRMTGLSKRIRAMSSAKPLAGPLYPSCWIIFSGLN